MSSTLPTTRRWVELLQMSPHPEGGFYKEIYRSSGEHPGSPKSEFPAGRAYNSSIYYCLESGDFSALHRLKSDEIWYFHDSTPNSRLVITRILPSEMIGPTLVEESLGKCVEKGQVFQVICRAGEWFGAHVEVEDEIEGKGERDQAGAVLVGCTVAPAFEFRDFEMGKREELEKDYPMFKEQIERLTRVI